MKLDLLTKALEHYVLTADCSNDDKREALIAIQDCSAVKERYDDADLWKNEVTITTACMLMDFLNLTTYDVYGKLYVTYDGDVPFDKYCNDCRKDIGFDHLTDEQLQIGFAYIRDLYNDNLTYSPDCHNPDGTFKK